MALRDRLSSLSRRPSSVSRPIARPLRWRYGGGAQVVGRARETGVAAGLRRPGQSKFDRAAESSGPGRRRRGLLNRRSSGGAVPEPDAARPGPAVVDRAGCGRRVLRSAGLRRAVVATAVGARRCAHLSAAGDVLELGDTCRAAGAVVPGRAPPGPVVAARRCAVDPVPPALRRLQPDDRPADGAGAGHSTGPRRHRLGNVHPGPTTASAHPAGPCSAGRGRSASARGPGTDGRAHPDRPGDARRARPPDLAAGAARWRARSPTRPAPGEGTRDR